MAGPDCDAVCGDILADTFKILRATPTALTGYPSANSLNRGPCGFTAGATGRTDALAFSGLTGTPIASPLHIINWDPLLIQNGGTATVDSTILAVYSAASGTINHRFGRTEIQTAFGECLPETSGNISGRCLFDACNSDSGVNPPDCPADGLLQFISQICASPTLSYLGQGLNLTIQPPRFPDPSNSAVCYQDQVGDDIRGCGNFNNINFTLGSCPGGCQKDITLLYIACPTARIEPALRTYGCGEWDVYPHNWVYANVNFKLSDKDGKLSSFKKACYLRVDPVSPANAFTVYFAQTRNCNGINILLICCLVDLACLYWQNRVYVVTAARALYPLPN